MDLLDGITKYWQVIAFVAFVIFNSSWGYSKIKEHDEKIKNLQDDGKLNKKMLIAIREDLREIKTVLKIKFHATIEESEHGILEQDDED